MASHLSHLLHVVDTTLVTLRGERDTGDTGERITPPGTIGIVTSVTPSQDECYRVTFPQTGAVILLTHDELQDPEQNRVLAGPEAELATLRCKARLYNWRHLNARELPPTGDDYNHLYMLIGA